MTEPCQGERELRDRAMHELRNELAAARAERDLATRRLEELEALLVNNDRRWTTKLQEYERRIDTAEAVLRGRLGGV